MPTCFFHFGLLFYGGVFCHTFKHLLGFISMIITFCPSQLKTVAVLYFFWEIWKTEIHVNARHVHNISVPVSFHLNKFFKCHGTCFMKPVHAPNLFVLTGTKDSVFFWKVFTEKQTNKTGAATLNKMISGYSFNSQVSDA